MRRPASIFTLFPYTTLFRSHNGKDIDGDASSSKGDGEELPKTATPMFNQLLIGFVLISIGGIALYVVRRRKQNRSEEHTSELQSRGHLVCRLLLEKKHKIAG